MTDLQKYADDARYYAVTYFAANKIMAWGEPREWLRISLMGEEFKLRIFVVPDPAHKESGPPIMYLDLVACGPDVDRSESAMHLNILARVVTLDYWEDGIVSALDALIKEGTETIIENPKWPG